MLLRIDNMTCAGCAQTIGRAVAALDDDVHLEVNLSQRLMRITSKAKPQEVLNAIESAGYRAVPAPEASTAARAACCGCGSGSASRGTASQTATQKMAGSCCR